MRQAFAHDAVMTMQPDADTRVPILYAAEPDLQNMVRERIDQALADGQLRGPDGSVTHWQLQSNKQSALTDQEAHHARRLAQS